jgi:polygalacturonase
MNQCGISYRYQAGNVRATTSNKLIILMKTKNPLSAHVTSCLVTSWISSVVALVLLAGCGTGNSPGGETGYFSAVDQSIYDGVQFDMPRLEVPKFPDYSVSIIDFGAVGDGKTLNTEAINNAIGHVAENGGGRVIVPAGIWLTGPVVLQSNINLHTEQGSLILFSSDFDHYSLIETSFEGLVTYRNESPISALGAENIAITGKGVIDGSGQAWRPVKRFKMTDIQWRNLIASGGVLNANGDTWYPSESSLQGELGRFTEPDPLRKIEDFGRVKDFLRPVMVSIRESRNILLDGPTFQNSPAWNIHPLMSENIIIRNLTVLNPWFSQNGDGIDLESSKNAFIYNNTFDVGDDAICIKSGKDDDGRRRAMPTENVIVKNNVVYHGHGGFVVGSEMSGDVRNIHVSDLTFIGTNVGIRFKSTRGRGGVVENIFISDINMVNIPTEPIRFNLYYAGTAPSLDQEIEILDMEQALAEIPGVTIETPQFRNITIKNVICRGAGSAMWIQGLPEMNVSNIRMENIDITSTKGGRLIDIDGIHMSKVRIEVDEGPVMYLNDTQNMTFDHTVFGYRENASSGPGFRLEGLFTGHVNMNGVELLRTNEAVSAGPNVQSGAFTVPESW